MGVLADYWLARSADGVTWTETHIDGPFDISTAPNVGGAYFLGDYMGLASSGAAFVSLYARTTGDPANRTDIFTRSIAATAEDSAAVQAAEMRLTEAAFERRSFDNLRQAVRARAMR